MTRKITNIKRKKDIRGLERLIVTYIDLKNESYTALEASVEACRWSRKSVDVISLDWYFYQYDDDMYYRKKYSVIGFCVEE